MSKTSYRLFMAALCLLMLVVITNAVYAWWYMSQWLAFAINAIAFWNVGSAIRLWRKMRMLRIEYEVHQRELEDLYARLDQILSRHR